MDGLESNFSRPDKYKMPPDNMGPNRQMQAEAENSLFVQAFRRNFERATDAEFPNASQNEKDQYEDFADRAIARLAGIPLSHASYLDSPLGKERALEKIFAETWEQTREEIEP